MAPEEREHAPSLHAQLRRLEEKYAIPADDPDRDQQLRASLSLEEEIDLDEAELREEEIESGEREPDYEGPLDANEVSLLGKEDALEVAKEARERSRKDGATKAILLSGDESWGLGIFENRVWQARAEHWTDALWNSYVRSFNAQLGAMDIEMILRGNTEYEGWSSAYVVDLRKWERNPKAKPSGELSDQWRRRGRWQRFRGTV
jgi:hypothetical protein